MKVLSRDVQLDILNKLAEAYPAMESALAMGFEQADRTWVVNAMYLHQQGLIEAEQVEYLTEGKVVIGATINHRGLDFLQEDGGLSAILNVVTVRLEAETLKALIAAKIDASDLPKEEKSKLKAWLQDLKEDGLKEVTKRLLDAALDQGPALLQLAQTALGSIP